MFKHIGTPSSFRELPAFHVHVEQARRQFEILVIDDEPFAPTSDLAKHGFQIVWQPDLEMVRRAHPYHVIVCDVKGVGQSLGSDMQGAHLLRELRLHFPDKYLILSSQHSFNARYNEYFRHVDVSVPKDSPIELWVSVLDEALTVVADPFKRWERLRFHLLSKNVMSLWELTRLEHALVSSIKKRKANDFKQVVDKISPQNEAMNALLKEFAVSLVADAAKAATTAIIAA